MGTAIRRATIADVDAVRRVGLETWPATYESFAGSEYVAHGLRTWWSEEAVLRGITEDLTFVAEDGGQVVGMAMLGNVDGQPVVWKLYVLPGHQGRGVGGALLDAAVAAARPESGPVLIEYAEGNERAAALYARHGFTEIGRDVERDGWPRTVWMKRVPKPAGRDRSGHGTGRG